MIVDTSKELFDDKNWKYQGYCKWWNKKVSFRTNSKYQYYQLKNGKMEHCVFIKRVNKNVQV